MFTSRKITALAVSTKERSPVLPDLPSATEVGVPGFEFNLWTGLLGPAKMPKEIIDKLSAEIVALQKEPEMMKRIEQLGAEPFVANSADFTRFYQAELEKWAGVIKAANLRID